MARGDSKSFSAYTFEAFEGDYTSSTDTYKWVIVTDNYTAIDADGANPKLTDFTQVASAGQYVANTTVANTTWARAANISTLDGDDWSYAADGANPTTGKSILIYNDTDADKSALSIIDLTIDSGTTPADTTQGLTYTVNANGIFRAVRTV